MISFTLFAQTDAAFPATPTTIIGAFIAVSLALVGLVGWILRHVFLTTIPSIVAEQKSQREGHDTATARLREANDILQKSQRDGHERAIDAICQAFKEESAAERRLCGEQFALVNATLTGLTSAIIQDSKITVAEINKHTTEAMVSYRHELHDKLNEAVLGKELYQLQLAKKSAAASPQTPT